MCFFLVVLSYIFQPSYVVTEIAMIFRLCTYCEQSIILQVPSFTFFPSIMQKKTQRISCNKSYHQ